MKTALDERHESEGRWSVGGVREGEVVQRSGMGYTGIGGPSCNDCRPGSIHDHLDFCLSFPVYHSPANLEQPPTDDANGQDGASLALRDNHARNEYVPPTGSLLRSPHPDGRRRKHQFQPGSENNGEQSDSLAPEVFADTYVYASAYRRPMGWAMGSADGWGWLRDPLCWAAIAHVRGSKHVRVSTHIRVSTQPLLRAASRGALAFPVFNSATVSRDSRPCMHHTLPVRQTVNNIQSPLHIVPPIACRPHLQLPRDLPPHPPCPHRDFRRVFPQDHQLSPNQTPASAVARFTVGSFPLIPYRCVELPDADTGINAEEDDERLTQTDKRVERGVTTIAVVRVLESQSAYCKQTK
ncbi:hypothetical protein C8F01DRAFT_1230935 [Mycena amicta]|nr:hypothetical protein C8F01DRAFT_1230935 [Mycena amicta]